MCKEISIVVNGDVHIQTPEEFKEKIIEEEMDIIEMLEWLLNDECIDEIITLDELSDEDTYERI